MSIEKSPRAGAVGLSQLSAATSSPSSAIAAAAPRRIG
jgi:hypothetical protein